MPLNQPAGDLIWSSLNSFKLLGWQHRLRKSMREKWRVALPRSHQSGQRRLGWSLSSLWSAVRYLAPAPGLENISPPGGQAALISGFASALKVAVAMGYLYASILVFRPNLCFGINQSWVWILTVSFICMTPWEAPSLLPWHLYLSKNQFPHR